ncbi:hypothetical protein WJX72_012264 [[Myrmecia] bisecta]|uniref:J domain-containing protein n=1 Tax=[Myrmecia] bisecta TaxID=41462 RepID=A0AAW1PPZ8_9CHLO
MPADPLLEAESAEPSADEAGPSAGPSDQAKDVGPASAEEEALLKEFFLTVREVDRDNEVNRILGAFKLNPFEQLGLHFDASEADIKKQYRKVSLLVHPDKCKHPRAEDAFQVLGNAQKELMEPEKMTELRYLLNVALEEVRKARKKATKHDAALRLASVLHEGGKEGVEAEYEKTDEFHEAWKLKARDIIARSKFRQIKMTKRLKEEEERIEEDEAETRKRLKASREHHQKWEQTRDTRVGTWRDFVTKKSKSKKGIATGGIKPPKLKEEDAEKTYIQRPVGEQHRPPQPKGPPPRGGKHTAQ